ncbi:Uma2 family endonuclease [Actinoplanes sp. NPDC051494]|uniref:Uma2 family endonuclease n=1 Tax=Actinoplanes sp. NPDC051494 TaxID=3363907 RepID=UPI00378E7AFC
MTAALSSLDDLGLADKQDWTVDDLASLPKDLRYELLHGRLVLSSPKTFHQWVAHKVASALEVNEPEDVYVVQDLSIAVDGRNRPRPDVVVVPDNEDESFPPSAGDVLLAVEVVSPDSTIRDRRTKVKLYAYAGIPVYWVIDPLGDEIVFKEHILGHDGEYHLGLARGGRIRLDRPWPVTLDLDAWQARRERSRRAR